MITTENLPFTASDIGIKKGFEFNGVTYFLRLRKNIQGNVFTMDVFDVDDNLIYADKLNYRREFGGEVSAGLPFLIVPMDLTEFFNLAEAQTEITEKNLGDTVLLYTSIVLG